MTIPHSEACITKRVHAGMRDYCECGASEIQSRLDQLEAERVEAEREVIERLIRDAETITIEGVGSQFTPRIVQASDLEDVLAGRLR